MIMKANVFMLLYVDKQAMHHNMESTHMRILILYVLEWSHNLILTTMRLDAKVLYVSVWWWFLVLLNFIVLQWIRWGGYGAGWCLVFLSITSKWLGTSGTYISYGFQNRSCACLTNQKICSQKFWSNFLHIHFRGIFKGPPCFRVSWHFHFPHSHLD